MPPFGAKKHVCCGKSVSVRSRRGPKCSVFHSFLSLLPECASVLTEFLVTQDVVPSELIAGKYRLTRLLGRGGMGSVWEGVHITLGNRVACKFIEPEYVKSEDAVRRFENEARAAASLKSKHVVDVYDHGIMPDGRPYIVMEFLAGEPLDNRLAKLGTLPLSQAAAIIQQVSRALYRAHGSGIIHRDLKPENIFLVWDDEDQTDLAKVVDFGIAKFTESSSTGVSSATRTGSIMGTPYYMSPEQARGLKNVDARSDNWSLGVIAYELVTGVRPYDGEAVGDILVKICTQAPVPPSQINPNLPPALDEWMTKALAQDPAARFQDVRQLAESLVTLAGAPGRTTMGSAVSAEGRTISSAAGGSGSVPHTKRDGTPDRMKKTSGALTHAAMETEVVGVPVRKTSPLVWIGAIGAIAVAVLAFVVSGSSSSSDEAAANAATSALTPSSPPSPAAVDIPRLPEPEAAEKAPDPPAESSQKDEPDMEQLTAEAAEKEAADSRPRRSSARVHPAPLPQPAPSIRAVVTPRPVPQAPAPEPAPAARPPAAQRPAPSPSNGNVDLGY